MATAAAAVKSRIILGIDPGTAIMGYGIIEVTGSQMKLLQYGVVHLSKYGDDHAIKLHKIFERIQQLIKEYLPDEMAIEAPFYGKNVQNMLKLGRAQGVAIAAAISRQVPVAEYEPRKIKMSVTGKGTSNKEDVAKMLQQLLHFKTEEKALLDATDALAVAVCHNFNRNSPTKKASTWEAFVTENKGRIK